MEESRPVDESKITEGDLTFYYSRDRRLAKSSQNVRDLYDPSKFKKGNLFTSLVDTKAKSMLFIAIIVLCVIVLLMTYVNPAKGNKLLENTIEVNALSYNGTIFVVIKKTAANKNAYSGIIDVSTNSLSGTAEHQTNSFVWSDLSEEEFRYSVPFNTKELLVNITAIDETTAGSTPRHISITVPVK